MTQFFKSKNNLNKYFIYLLITKGKDDTDTIENDLDYNFIETKIIITKNLILHDLNYILNNYETIINNELEYKIIEHCVYKYCFEKDVFNGLEFPKYPYDIFVLNRVLLYSFYYIMKNNISVKDILLKEKIHIVSNMNFLKRIKDWNSNWKKNRYSIEKYQNSNDFTESIFSINTLSQYYFNIEKEEEKNYLNNTNKILFSCKPVLFENKSLFERSVERPNTDYIEMCSMYFEEEKYIKFI